MEDVREQQHFINHLENKTGSQEASADSSRCLTFCLFYVGTDLSFAEITATCADA